MKILFLSFYFEPDLSAGSFRNTSLFDKLCGLIDQKDSIDLFTTFPNRYNSYEVNDIKETEFLSKNILVNRIQLPKHNNSFKSQIKSFHHFYRAVVKATKNEKYDLVYASSSKLFTAFLGARIADKNNVKLYLDIRDIFRESIKELYKNPFVRLGLDLFLKPVEYYTFKNASHINLVSKGFQSYFDKIQKPTYSFYTNGIDEIFLNETIKQNLTKEVSNKEKEVLEIIYAGNIGEGQGLHNIIPNIAKGLGNKYKITIYGDGGCREKLEISLKENGVNNVSINKPIRRDDLIDKYHEADFLFLHLNAYKAFERVLPSKLFEYGTFDKPIIAGVGGYAAEFLEKNMKNTILFDPCDSKQALTLIKNYQYQNQYRSTFLEKYSRENINLKMANSILKLVN